MHFSSSLLSTSVLISFTLAASTASPPQPICNAADEDWSQKTHHAGEVLEFIRPGTGACGTLGYRHSTNAACVHPSW